MVATPPDKVERGSVKDRNTVITTRLGHIDKRAVLYVGETLGHAHVDRAVELTHASASNATRARRYRSQHDARGCLQHLHAVVARVAHIQAIVRLVYCQAARLVEVRLRNARDAGLAEMSRNTPSHGQVRCTSGAVAT